MSALVSKDTVSRVQSLSPPCVVLRAQWSLQTWQQRIKIDDIIMVGPDYYGVTPFIRGRVSEDLLVL